MTTERVLFVDDEPAVLDGYKRLLHRDFSIDTAVGPMQGLYSIANGGPYAVVVSDMRMPEMDGARFLAKVRQISPDSVRIALTGYADIETSIHAVNEGNIFRFLTKPCPKDVLAGALNTAIEQHRLVAAEKELLEKTLSGSIKVLTEVISIVNPLVFSCTSRIRGFVRSLVDQSQLPAPWRFDVAAMLSQLGCVVLHPDIVKAVYSGQEISPADQARFDSHPWIARDLLANIPRLEPIAWMIAHQQSSLAELASATDGQSEDVIAGARILSVAVAQDRFLSQGNAFQQALEKLKTHQHLFDPAIVAKLEKIKPDTRTVIRSCHVSELQPGMVLQEEVRTSAGVLVVAKGQEISYPLTIRLKNFLNGKAIPETVVVAAQEPIAAETQPVPSIVH